MNSRIPHENGHRCGRQVNRSMAVGAESRNIDGNLTSYASHKKQAQVIEENEESSGPMFDDYSRDLSESNFSPISKPKITGLELNPSICKSCEHKLSDGKSAQIRASVTYSKHNSELINYSNDSDEDDQFFEEEESSTNIESGMSSSNTYSSTQYTVNAESSTNNWSPIIIANNPNSGIVLPGNFIPNEGIANYLSEYINQVQMNPMITEIQKQMIISHIVFIIRNLSLGGIFDSETSSSLGFDTNEINRFPIFSFKKPKNVVKEEQDQKCTICFSDFESGEQVKMLPCFHKFHSSCIDVWLRQKTTCPICKDEMMDYM